MILKKVLLIKVLLVNFTTQTLVEYVAECRDNVMLKCSGLDSMDFQSVTWYKVNETVTKGIIMWDKMTNKMMPYPFTRPVQFGQMYSLFLSSVVPEDSGLYECEISAVLGDLNRHPRVNLTVRVCAAETEPTTTTTSPNSTQLPRLEHQEDLPVLLSVTCITALAKIIISVIGILIFRAVCMKYSRQRQLHW